MWHFKSKYQRIKVLIKVNCKQLKAFLAPKIRKLDLTFLVLNLGKFLIFDKF